tara:strand:- start:8185 stop:8556 length:372 start_codon:yes stop_codon:yes gene_type:complete
MKRVLKTIGNDLFFIGCGSLVGLLFLLIVAPPAKSVEIPASDFKLHCNQGPGQVFAVLESNDGSFMGFDHNGNVSIAMSANKQPVMVGSWEFDGSDVALNLNGNEAAITGLFTKKCDTYFTFN